VTVTSSGSGALSRQRDLLVGRNGAEIKREENRSVGAAEENEEGSESISEMRLSIEVSNSGDVRDPEQCGAGWRGG